MRTKPAFASKKSGTPKAVAVPFEETNTPEKKSNDVVLAIKVFVIAAAAFGAIWALEHFLAK